MPSKLWDNLNLLYGKSRPPAWVRSVIGSTIGGSDLVTPTQPGIDFGNPRFGFNTFDWLMWQLKAQCVEGFDEATTTVHGCN